MIHLGTCVDGRALHYDATLYEFRLDRSLVSYSDVRELDNHAHLTWNAPEQRDWFRKINPADLDRCNRRALNRHGNGYEQLSPEEQVLADAKRDDSVLAGKIVDADPALVQAVAAALEEQGLLGRAGAPAGAPQVVIGMPQGMEALSQLQKQEGRKMTAAEHYLMRKILKNDDKEKAKRERYAAKLEASEAREEEKESQALSRKASINRAQKRVARKDKKRERDVRNYSDQALQEFAGYDASGHNREDLTAEQAFARADAGAWDLIEEINGRQAAQATARPGYGHAAAAQQATVYYDSYGNPIRPEADAMRPSMSQQAYHLTEEERALYAMRQRNLAEQAQYQAPSNNVPGMDEARGGKRKRRRNEGASVNGHEVNADGTMKDTRFSKAMKGLGQFNQAISPLLGGGGGGGMGGSGGGGMGGMGGSGGGGGMGGGGGRGGF